MSTVAQHLAKMEPISLAEMDNVALLNRTDTKFAFSSAALPDLLLAALEDYRVLEIGGKRQMRYRTQYFDTPDYSFYLAHHNQRRNRMKVRMREYSDSDLCFLEIKQKRNTGRTEKTRIRIAGLDEQMPETGRTFIQETSSFSGDLVLALHNRFQRITLVHKRKQERFTIDCDLGFSIDGREVSLPKAVIAEIKQSRASRNTSSFRIMRSLGVRPMGISKYCIGAMLLMPDLKANNFKRKRLYLDKL